MSGFQKLKNFVHGGVDRDAVKEQSYKHQEQYGYDRPEQPGLRSDGFYHLGKAIDGGVDQNDVRRNADEAAKRSNSYFSEPEKGLEGEGFLDILRPYKEAASEKAQEYGVPAWITAAADMMTPDGPDLLGHAKRTAKALKRGTQSNVTVSEGAWPSTKIDETPSYNVAETTKLSKDRYHHVFNDEGDSSIVHVISKSPDPKDSKSYLSKLEGVLEDHLDSPIEGRKGLRVEGSVTREIGKGQGKEVYKNALGYHGHIESDTTLTPGSHAVYKNYLSDLPGVQPDLSRVGDETASHYMKIGTEGIEGFWEWLESEYKK